MSQSPTSRQGHRQPAKPGVAAYTHDDLFPIRVFLAEAGVEKPLEAAEERISGPKGKGPHCCECGEPPAGLVTLGSSPPATSGPQRYRCLRCGTTQCGPRRQRFEQPVSEGGSR